MFHFGAVEALLVLAIALGVFVWWLVMLIEALRIPDSAWAAAGHNKLLRVLVMVLLGVLGTILHLLIVPRGMARRGAV